MQTVTNLAQNNVRNVLKNLVLAEPIPVGQVRQLVKMPIAELSDGLHLQQQITKEILLVTNVLVHTHLHNVHTPMPIKERQPLQKNVVTVSTKLVNQIA